MQIHDFYYAYKDDGSEVANKKSILVIVWHKIEVVDSNLPNSFEVQLYLSNSTTPGKIVFRYGEISNVIGNTFSDYRLIGISNGNGSFQGNIDLSSTKTTDTESYINPIQYFIKNYNEMSLLDLVGKELTYTPIDKKGANVSGGDFTGVDFTNQSNLQYVDFTNAILIGANFTNCDLSYSIFKGANLSEAILKGANLTNVNFKDANLSYANLIGATTTNADFTGADQSNQINTTRTAEFQEILTLQTNLNGGKVYSSSEERNNDQKKLQDLKTKLQYSSTRYDPNFKLLPGSYSYNYENTPRN